MKNADVPQANVKPEKTNEKSTAFPKQINGSIQGIDKKTAKAEIKKGSMYTCKSVTIETESKIHPPINSKTESLAVQERNTPTSKPEIQENARINVDTLRKCDLDKARKKRFTLTPTPYLLSCGNHL